MPRPVTELLKAKVKTPDGNSLQVDSKGSITEGIKTVFICLDTSRREKLLAALTKKHEEMLARQA